MSRALLTLFAAVALAISSGPDDRQLTDPMSVVSPTNSAGKPVPIDDLFYTRSISGPSWSPNGKEIVFTTGLYGPQQSLERTGFRAFADPTVPVR